MTRDHGAAAGISNGKLTSENRRVDERRSAHEDRENLIAVLLKDLFFNRDKQRQRRAGNRREAHREFLEFLLTRGSRRANHGEHRTEDESYHGFLHKESPSV